MKLELTIKERLTLANQYRILALLDSDQKETYEEFVEILEQGYVREYGSLARHIDSNDVSAEDCAKVVDTLDMFRMLKNAYRELPAGNGIDPDSLEFQGFDGNEETPYHAYVEFLLHRQGKWAESKDAETNSHRPMLPRYMRMVEAWRESGDRYNLTESDIRRIIAA